MVRPIDSRSSSTTSTPTARLLSNPIFSSPPNATSRGPVHAGACWEGVQRSGRNVYKVKVDISTVDLAEGTLSGMLQIRHLTPELESLVTFFEGEIIGDKAGFLTGRWGASETDDMKHWSRFPAFSKGLRQSLTKPNLNFKHSNRPFLFMRWKEKFVVPSSHAQNIHGASFAGFYYLCLDFDVPHSTLSANGEIARATSPPARGSYRSRSFSADHTRLPPTPVRSPSYEPVVEDEDELGAGDDDNDRSRIIPPPPAPPRRASSSSFSYAAAVRGDLSPTLGTIDLPNIDSLPTPPPTENPTPKEVDTPELALAAMSSSSSESPSRTISPLASPRTNVSSLPISIPTPAGTTEDDFPVPSSPPLGGGAFGSPPSVRAGRFFGAPSSIHSRTSQGDNSRSRATSNTIDSVVLGSDGEAMSGLGRSRSFGSNQHATIRSRSASASGVNGYENAGHGDSDFHYGQKSWMNCEIKGFYFFRHSEPYQELSLRYVPKNKGSTQAFAFR